MKKKELLFLFFVLLPVFQENIFSQLTDIDRFFPPISILQSNDPAPGYFFVATMNLKSSDDENYIAIFDNYGIPVYFRLADKVASGIQVKSGKIFLVEGQKKYFGLDTMLMKTDTFMTIGYPLDDHDIDIDSDNHVLLLGDDLKTVNLSSVGGLADATVKDKIIQEFDENGNLLYTWTGLDHFAITDANENSPFVDLTASTVDYLHANSLAFDSDTSFLLSCRHFDEITKIDRRNGNIIWRFGGKQNQFNVMNDTLGFSHPHTVRKLANGNIMIFDNGNLDEPPASSVVEYELNEQAMTARLVRRQYHKPLIFADHYGGQELLPDGDLLVYWGEETPSFTEYHPDGSVAIEVDFSTHSFSNRIAKSTWKHKVFVTNTDTINYGMWDGYTESNYLLRVKNNTDSVFTLTGYHTMTPYFYIQEQCPISIPAKGEVTLTVTYFPDTAQTGCITDVLTLQANYPHVYLGQQVFLKGKKEDTQPPEMTISPDTANVPRDATIHFHFSEPVRLDDLTELNYLNVDTLIIFRKFDAFGDDIPFDAVVATNKMHISVYPSDSLDPDQTYYVALKYPLVDCSGNTVLPASAVFSTGLLNAVHKRESLDFTLFPNPSTGIFNIRLSGTSKRIVSVYSLTGEKVYADVWNFGSQHILNLSGLSSGMYIVRIENCENAEVVVVKVMLRPGNADDL